MIFITLGTTYMRFDRLVKGMDIAVREGILEGEVFAQIGFSKYIPQYMEYTRMLEKRDFDDFINSSELIIGHAGMGTINMALKANKNLIVVPRRKKYKEHVNDHQLWTAEKFVEMGHVVSLDDPMNLELLTRALEKARMFKPKKRISRSNDLARDIWQYMKSLP